MLEPPPADASPARTPPPGTRLADLAREPLVHFVLAGAALFALYAALGRGPGQVQDRRIELTRDDVARLALAWRRERNQEPSADELRQAVEDEVRKEVLAREAIALGLDRNDGVIKGLLAQKMQFIGETATRPRVPTEAEMRAWFRQQPAFPPVPLATFRPCFFSARLRGERAEADARAALGAEAPAGDDGFDTRYVEQSADQVAMRFGAGVADALFQQPVGAWRGPLRARDGFLLVQVEAVRDDVPPTFEQVATMATQVWQKQQREAAAKAFYERLRARYQVVVADPATVAGPSDAQ